MLAVQADDLRHRPTDGERAADDCTRAGSRDEVEAAPEIKRLFAANPTELIRQSGQNCVTDAVDAAPRPANPSRTPARDVAARNRDSPAAGSRMRMTSGCCRRRANRSCAPDRERSCCPSRLSQAGDGDCRKHHRLRPSPFRSHATRMLINSGSCPMPRNREASASRSSLVAVLFSMPLSIRLRSPRTAADRQTRGLTADCSMTNILSGYERRGPGTPA